MKHNPSQRRFAVWVVTFCLVAVGLGTAFGALGIRHLIGTLSEPTVQPPAVTVTKKQPAKVNLPGAWEAVNAYRATQHLPYLALDDQLSNSAQAKADDLVANNYWAHERTGATPWNFITDAGYDYARAGENLAKCYKTIDAVVDAWVASPTHHAVLVGDYQDVGFGIANNPRNGCDYVVGHFGTRQGEQ